MEKPYVIIRSANSGVHAGYLESVSGDTVTLTQSRRLWLWTVARMSGSLTSLSELAVYGLKSGDSRNRIAVELPSIQIFGVCEVIPTSEQAKASICNER